MLQGLSAAETYPRSIGRRLLQYNINNRNCQYYGNCTYYTRGRLAGIIVGCVCFALALLFIILAFTIRRRRMARYQVRPVTLRCEAEFSALISSSLLGFKLTVPCVIAGKHYLSSWHIPCGASTKPDLSSGQYVSQSSVSSEHRGLQPSCISTEHGGVQPSCIQPWCSIPEHSYRHACNWL